MPKGSELSLASAPHHLSTSQLHAPPLNITELKEALQVQLADKLSSSKEEGDPGGTGRSRGEQKQQILPTLQRAGGGAGSVRTRGTYLPLRVGGAGPWP